MKKIVFMLFTTLIIILGGCSNNKDVEELSVSSIKIKISDNEVTEINLELGESVELIGEVVYSDNSVLASDMTWNIEDETIANFVDGQFVALQSGMTKITLSKSGKSITVPVIVKELLITLEKITITKPAEKTKYFIGEQLDITGVEVTGIYSDESRKVETIIIEDILGFDSDTIGTKLILITLEGKTVNYEIELFNKFEIEKVGEGDFFGVDINYYDIDIALENPVSVVKIYNSEDNIELKEIKLDNGIALVENTGIPKEINSIIIKYYDTDGNLLEDTFEKNLY